MLSVPFEAMQSRVPVDDVLELFLCPFGESNLSLIVESTNAYAEYFTQRPYPRDARPWYPLSRNELIIFLGTLFFMGRHREHNREDCWAANNNRLGKYMPKTRWEQIHRFFTVNACGREPGQPWFYKLEPLASRMRENWGKACRPTTWLAVDEMMIAFTGRCAYTTKLLKKPIKEGFKMWAIRWTGYIGSFRLHSGGGDMDEGMCTRMTVPQEEGTINIAPTQQVPIILANREPSKKNSSGAHTGSHIIPQSNSGPLQPQEDGSQFALQ